MYREKRLCLQGGDKIETSLNLFFLYFFSRGLSFRDQIKKQRFKLVSILSSKMFYGHAIFIGGNSQKGTRYLFFPPGLSLSRPEDTKTDFNFNNIIATLSLISISSIKQFAGKCPDTYSNLISTPLDECQSW